MTFALKLVGELDKFSILVGAPHHPQKNQLSMVTWIDGHYRFCVIARETFGIPRSAVSDLRILCYTDRTIGMVDGQLQDASDPAA